MQPSQCFDNEKCTQCSFTDTAKCNDNGGSDIAGTADIGNSQYLEKVHTQAHDRLINDYGYVRRRSIFIKRSGKKLRVNCHAKKILLI